MSASKHGEGPLVELVSQKKGGSNISSHTQDCNLEEPLDMSRKKRHVQTDDGRPGPRTVTHGANSSSASHLDGGWLQINDTLVPHIKTQFTKLLPLSVLRNAANLLRSRPISYQRATERQSSYLNSCCKEAGLNFRFAKHTKLVTVEVLTEPPATNKLLIKELPKGNPFDHIEENTQEATEDSTKAADIIPPLFGGLSVSQLWPTLSPLSLMPEHSLLSGIGLPLPGTGLPSASVGEPQVRTPEVNSQQMISPWGGQGVNTPFSPWLEVGPVNIQPIQFKGKAISCLVEGSQRYALLEVVSRVYFPRKSLSSLLLVLSKLCVPTRALTMREELAFIEFYNLPTRALHCKKVISIAMMDKHYDNLDDILQCADDTNRQSEVREAQLAMVQSLSFRPWMFGPYGQLKKAADDPASRYNTPPKNGIKKSGNPRKRRLEETVDKLRSESSRT